MTRPHLREALAAGAVHPTHGRVSTYQNYGCRCDRCKAAASDYRQGRTVDRPASRGRGRPPTSHLPRCLYCHRPLAPIAGESAHGTGFMHADDRRELGADGHRATLAYAEASS